MTLFEVNQAAALIRETSHPDVNLIFGAVIDPDMTEEVRVTVIATGFERTGMPRRVNTVRPSIQQRPTVGSLESNGMDAQKVSVQNAEFKPQTFNTEDLDIPTFLRNRK